mmetsp:Transcript_17975/g.23419  ORF Transcript_17975/g.23419 Transcript_17975/m.23419 type:complete len:270 (+) Transcript_17975:36-845(+)
MSCRFTEEWDQGKRAYKEKRWGDSVKHFTQAIQAAGTESDEEKLYLLYSNRSAGYQQLNDWTNALDDAETVIALKPGFAKGWQRLATCLRVHKRYNEAEAAQKKARELNPGNYASSQPFTRGRTNIYQWLQNLDLNSLIQYIDTKTIIIIVLVIMATYSIFFRPRYPYYGGSYPYHSYGNSYSSTSYGGSSGGVGMTGLLLLMLAAWKLPPFIGHPPFFGMSPFTLLWLIQTFIGGGARSSCRPRPGFGTGLFGGAGRRGDRYGRGRYF